MRLPVVVTSVAITCVAACSSQGSEGTSSGAIGSTTTEQRFDNALDGNADEVTRKVDAAIRAKLGDGDYAKLQAFDWSTATKADLLANESLRDAIKAAATVLDSLGVKATPASFDVRNELSPLGDPPPAECLAAEERLTRWGLRAAKRAVGAGITCAALSGPGPWCLAAMAAAVGLTILAEVHATSVEVAFDTVMTELNGRCCVDAVECSAAVDGDRCCSSTSCATAKADGPTTSCDCRSLQWSCQTR